MMTAKGAGKGFADWEKRMIQAEIKRDEQVARVMQEEEDKLAAETILADAGQTAPAVISPETEEDKEQLRRARFGTGQAASSSTAGSSTEAFVSAPTSIFPAPPGPSVWNLVPGRRKPRHKETRELVIGAAGVGEEEEVIPDPKFSSTTYPQPQDRTGQY